jgi:hypothetical protein
MNSAFFDLIHYMEFFVSAWVGKQGVGVGGDHVDSVRNTPFGCMMGTILAPKPSALVSAAS